MNFYHINFKFEYNGELPLLTSQLRQIHKSLWMNLILPNMTTKDLINLENTCCHFKDLVVKNGFWRQACASRTQPLSDPFAAGIEAIANVYKKSSLYRALYILRELSHEPWQLEKVTDNAPIGKPIGEQVNGRWKITLPKPESRVITELFTLNNWSLTIEDSIGSVAQFPIEDKVLNFYQTPNGFIVKLATFRENYILKPDINNLISNLNQWMSKAKPQLSHAEAACQESLLWARRMRDSASGPLKFRRRTETLQTNTNLTSHSSNSSDNNDLPSQNVQNGTNLSTAAPSSSSMTVGRECILKEGVNYRKLVYR